MSVHQGVEPREAPTVERTEVIPTTVLVGAEAQPEILQAALGVYIGVILG